MGKPTLHALLIGINKYSPQSTIQVPSLGGTHQDVKGIEGFLKDRLSPYFQDIHSKVLKDAEATYTNVINAFHEELCQKSKPGDTVLFYFSGHGSFQPSAKELWPFNDSKRTDETLVCYDSRIAGHYDLADKEIAVLLSLFNPEVDVIMLVDSCFSSSITRDDEEEILEPGENSRHLPRKLTPRLLHEYFNKPAQEEKDLPLVLQNYYTQLESREQLHIPSSRHLVITACTREQKAYENVGGGYFTTFLLRILNKQVSIPYVSLFQRLRSSVLGAKKQSQTPTFEVFGTFNTQQFFLQRAASETTEHYQVQYHDQVWKFYNGALHGLELPEKEKIWLQISPTTQSAASPGQPAVALPERAFVKELLMNYSILDFEGPNPLNQDQIYQASIISLPNPKLRVFCDDKIDPNVVDAFKQMAFELPIRWIFSTLREEANYELIFDESVLQRPDAEIKVWDLRIQHVKSGKFIYGIKYPQSAPPQPLYGKIIACLNHIEKWERLLSVERTDSALAKTFSWALEYTDPTGHVHTIEDKEITLLAPPEGVLVNIVVRNNSSRNLYLSCFDFDQEHLPSYGKSRKGYVIKNLNFQNFELQPGATARLFDRPVLVKAKIIPDSLIQLKMVASTELIDGYLYQELAAGIPLGYEEGFKRDKGDQSQPAKVIKNDWVAENMKLRVVKAHNVQQQDLTSGKLHILQNSLLDTKVNIGYVGAPGGQSKVLQSLQQSLEQKNLGLQGFSDPRYWELLGDQTASSIELNDLPQGALPQALQIQLERPLDLNTEGLPIPIAYDEQNDLLLPFGKLLDGDQHVQIEIQELPDAGEDHSRSLGRALVFGLLKMNLKVDLSQLRMADYSGEPLRYIHDFPTIKVQAKAASKILLIIHGFLGNTRQEAESFRNAVNDGRYDLVLTFDYENLNSTVIEIAKKLHHLLCDKKDGIGIGPGDGKELTVVAHSLGGLVARFWVEHLLKDEDTVDRLLLIGVPNAGSTWGKANDWISFFNASIALLINLFTGQLQSALGKLQKLIGAANPEETLKTLNEMKPGSDILSTLATSAPPPHTQYTLIAGNAQLLCKDAIQFEEKRPLLARIGARLNKLWLKLSYTVGDWFYTEQNPHDCFATVESQLSLPFEPSAKHVIPAHHYGYFEHSATEDAIIISIILNKP